MIKSSRSIEQAPCVERWLGTVILRNPCSMDKIKLHIRSTYFSVTNIKSQTNIFPYIALLIGILGLGMSAIFVKWASEASGVVIAFYRVGIAALIMVIPFSAEVKRNISARRYHLIWAIIAGLFSPPISAHGTTRRR